MNAIIGLLLLMFFLPSSAETHELVIKNVKEKITHRFEHLAEEMETQGLQAWLHVLDDERLHIYPAIQSTGIGWKRHIHEELFSVESARNGLLEFERYAAVFQRAYDEYGIPPEILIAVAREERNFGKMIERHMALSVFYKKIVDPKTSPKKIPWFALNFLEALHFCKDLGIKDCFSVFSSHEGASGPTQILHANRKLYGVSFDWGPVDLRKPEDAYLTTAKMLYHLGFARNPVRALTCYLGCPKENISYTRNTFPYNYVGAVLTYAAGLRMYWEGKPLNTTLLVQSIRELNRSVQVVSTPKKKRKTPRRTAARAFFIDPAKKNRTINHTELNRKIVLADFSAGHNHLFRHDEYRTSFRISRQKHSLAFQSFNHLWFEVCNNHHFLID